MLKCIYYEFSSEYKALLKVLHVQLSSMVNCTATELRQQRLGDWCRRTARRPSKPEGIGSSPVVAEQKENLLKSFDEKK